MYPYVAAILIILLCCGLGAFLQWCFDKPPGPRIDTGAKCPACGHCGCNLAFIPPRKVWDSDDNGRFRTRAEEARVERQCKTCGAKVYEKTILEYERWMVQ